MRIRLKNGSFSGSGLGSSGNPVDAWADIVGITDPTQRSGLRTFYNSCVSAGIWSPSKLAAVMIYPGDTAAKQKYLFDLNQTPRQLTFTGSTVHSSLGFDPNGAGNASIPFTPPAGDFRDFSGGVYTSEGESAPASSTTRRMLLDAQGENPGDGTATYSIKLARRFQGDSDVTATQIGTTGAGYVLLSGAITTKSGFLQMVRTGNVLTLIDDGVQVAENANYNTTIAKGGGTRTVKLGSDNQGIQFSTANQKFAYIGYLTKTEAITFDGIVKTLMTALGR
jgi:hypothetical protein